MPFMIKALLVLLLCQFLGEILVYFSGIPVPGPVVGMCLLLVGLIVKGSLPENLDSVASSFIHYIGLLFVPAGAGISLYLGLLAKQWDVILIASFTSTVLTLVLCAFVFQILSKKSEE